MTAGYPVVLTAHPCGHQKVMQSMEQEADFQADHADECGANQFTTPADVQVLPLEGGANPMERAQVSSHTDR